MLFLVFLSYFCAPSQSNSSGYTLLHQHISTVRECVSQGAFLEAEVYGGARCMVLLSVDLCQTSLSRGHTATIKTLTMSYLFVYYPFETLKHEFPSLFVFAFLHPGGKKENFPLSELSCHVYYCPLKLTVQLLLFHGQRCPLSMVAHGLIPIVMVGLMRVLELT